MFALYDMKTRMRGAVDRVFIACASAAFMALAMVTIQYDEVIAPEMARASDVWGSAATDIGRKLSSLAL
jgi:hypothetical protein